MNSNPTKLTTITTDASTTTAVARKTQQTSTQTKPIPNSITIGADNGSLNLTCFALVVVVLFVNKTIIFEH